MKVLDWLEAAMTGSTIKCICAAFFLTAVCDRLNLGFVPFICGYIAWMASAGLLQSRNAA